MINFQIWKFPTENIIQAQIHQGHVTLKISKFKIRKECVQRDQWKLVMLILYYYIYNCYKYVD